MYSSRPSFLQTEHIFPGSTHLILSTHLKNNPEELSTSALQVRLGTELRNTASPVEQRSPTLG